MTKRNINCNSKAINKNFIQGKVLASLLIHAVLENDEMDVYEEPCKVNMDKYNGFHKAIEILTDLKAKGKCDFKASDIRKEYLLHTIYVKWELTDGFYLCIDSENKTEIKMLLDCMDECLISDDEANVWQLSSRIYTPIRENEEE